MVLVVMLEEVLAHGHFRGYRSVEMGVVVAGAFVNHAKSGTFNTECCCCCQRCLDLAQPVLIVTIAIIIITIGTVINHLHLSYGGKE